MLGMLQREEANEPAMPWYGRNLAQSNNRRLSESAPNRHAPEQSETLHPGGKDFHSFVSRNGTFGRASLL